MDPGDGDENTFILDEPVPPDISKPTPIGPLIIDLTVVDPLCDGDLLRPRRTPE